MTNKLYTFFILLFSYGILMAQTDVEGTITDQIWNSSDSPYHVIGDVEVESLTIEPGVTVYFDDDFHFDVTGSLEAIGFHSDSILFLPTPDNLNGWQGLIFTPNASESALSYCHITGAKNQGILFDNCESPVISNCRISNNPGDGIRVKNTSVDLYNCIISRNSSRGVYLEQATFSAENTIISKNEEGIYSLYEQDVIYLLNSVIADNSSKSILCLSGTVDIQNSILYHNHIEIGSNDTTHIKATYSNIDVGVVYPGTGNINQSPEFFDSNSYTLTDQSPCVDAGNPISVYSDIFFPPSLKSSRTDMGAYGGPGAGNWYPPLYIQPQPIDFGQVTVDSSKTVPVKIKNYRDKPVNVSEITFTDSPDYFITNLESFSVAVSDSAELLLTFTPKKNGLIPSGLLLNIAFDGTVLAPIKGEGVIPKISIPERNLPFGTAVIGSSTSLDLGILNIGTDTLRIQHIYSTNPVFTVNDSVLKIDPFSEIVQVQVKFTPDSAMTYQDSIIILCNDPEEPRISIPVSGTGQKGALLQLGAAVLDFSSVLVMTDSLLSLPVKNSGDQLLSITDITITATDTTTGAFELVNAPSVYPYELKPDSLFILQVLFKPEQPGFDVARLTFKSNDFFEQEISIPLSGWGLAPVFDLSLAVVDFDSVGVGRDSIQILELQNSGDADLQIFDLKIDPQDSLNPVFDFAGAPLAYPINIASGNKFDLSVRYNVQKTGADSTTLYIMHSDPFKDDVLISLKGHGISSVFDASQFALDFGKIPFDADSIQNLTIYNRGSYPLIIFSDSLQISGTDSSLFNLTTNIIQDLIIAPKKSIVFPIRFNPFSIGIKQAKFYIACNDPQTPNRSFLLSGTGTDNSAAETKPDSINSTSTFVNQNAAVLSFNIISSSEPDSAILFLRKGGESNYQKLDLIKQKPSGFWQTEINSALVTERGLEYYIRVYHGFMMTTTVKNHIPVSVPELAFTGYTLKEKYQMISVPVFTNGQTLSELFTDDLGTYNIDNYRIFDCTDGSTYSEITELNVPLPPGKALWLITKEPVQLDITGGHSIDFDHNYSLHLKQGWNMISSPFAFPVSWAEVDINHPLSYYDGTGWVYESTLNPYGGYAVYVYQDTILSVPPKESPSSIPLAKSTALAEEQNWQIQIQAQSGSFKDSYNFAGVNEKAINTPDRFDCPEPPPIGQYISVYFTQPEHPGFMVTKYAADYRAPDEQGYIFSFEVSANFSGEKTILLTPENLPENFDWAVSSSETKVKYNKEHITINGRSHKFQLAVGTEEFISETLSGFNAFPTEFKLNQNYPNPFNPNTIINYQLPNANYVNLTIYNILGQRIKTLQKYKPHEAGYYQIKWDGTNAAGKMAGAGIYFLHLKTKQFNKSIKMILQK